MATEVLQLGIDSTGALSGARQFERAATSVQQSATKADGATKKMDGGFNRLRSSAMTLTRTLGALGITIGAGALVRSIARATADMDTLRLSLDAVTGSSVETARQLKALREVAKLPGLGFKEAVQGAVNLEVVGFSAKETIRVLKDFGNAVALTGGGKNELDRIIFQFTQMSSLGKVTSQDLKPILQTAPAVAKAMLAVFGTISPEKIEAMGLTFDQFVARLLTGLEQLPHATGGVKNSFENLSDAVFQASAAFGTEFSGAVGDTINKLAGALQSFADNRQAVADLALGVKSLVKALGVVGLAAAIGYAGIAMGALLDGAFALAAGLTSLRAAVMTLNAALGPVGWFVVGVSVVATYLYASGKAATDAASGLDAYAASLRNLNRAQLLVEQSDLDKRIHGVKQRLATTPATTERVLSMGTGGGGRILEVANPKYAALQTALTDLESQSKRVHDALGMIFDPPNSSTNGGIEDALKKEKDAVALLVDLYGELAARKQDASQVVAAGESLAASLFRRAGASAPGSAAQVELLKLESQLAEGLDIPLQIDLPASRVEELRRQLERGLVVTPTIAVPGSRPTGTLNLGQASNHATEYAERRARVEAVLNEAQQKSIREFNDTVDAVKNVTGAFGEMADALGDVDPALANALRGVETLVNGASRVRAGQSQGGMLGMFAQVSGVVGMAAGALQLAKGLFEDSERDALLKQNNEALDRLRQSLENPATFGDTLTTLSTIDAVQARPGFKNNQRPSEIARFSEDERKAIKEAADRFGIDVFDKNGKIVRTALQQLEDALRDSALSVAEFGKTVAGQKTLRDAFNEIFDITDPGKLLQSEFDLLAQRSGGLFGDLKNLDLTSGTGRDVLETRIRDLITKAMGGELTATDLSGFSSVQEFIDSLLSIDHGLDGFAKSINKANEAVTDIPKAINLALYRRQFGSGVPGGGSDVPAFVPGTPADTHPSNPGTGGLTIEGGVTIEVRASDVGDAESFARTVTRGFELIAAKGGPSTVLRGVRVQP